MSEAKFTKGPWVKCADTVGIRCNDDTQEYGMVKAVAYIEPFDFKEQWEVNAHLIAAAPEMYGMISLLLKNSTFNTEHPVFADEFEKLLAKARGES